MTKKAEVIVNEMEGQTALVEYELPPNEIDLVLDFVDSEDLETIEQGIQKIEHATDILALAQGIAIVKIESEGLWRQGGYETLQGYREAQNERLGLSRGAISQRRRIAEAWLANRKLLAKVELDGNISKLAYFQKAIELRENKREVLEHFKKDTFREFVEYANPSYPRGSELPEVEAAIRDGKLIIDGDPIMEVYEDVDADEKEFVIQVLRAAYKARKANCIAQVLPVYDAGEARAVENFLKKHRAEM